MKCHIRVIEQDLPQLLALGCVLGVIRSDDGGNYHGEGWVPIGRLTEATGQYAEDPDTGLDMELRRVIADTEGRPYWHANLVIDFDLREHAMQLLGQHPELAEALQQLDRFFVVDELGNPKAPANPQVRIFGDE